MASGSVCPGASSLTDNAIPKSSFDLSAGQPPTLRSNDVLTMIEFG